MRPVGKCLPESNLASNLYLPQSISHGESYANADTLCTEIILVRGGAALYALRSLRRVTNFWNSLYHLEEFLPRFLPSRQSSVVTSGSQWRAVSLTASAPSHRGDKALIRLLPSPSATSSSERSANCGTRYSHELRNCSSAKIPDSCVAYLKDFCKRFVH